MRRRTILLSCIATMLVALSPAHADEPQLPGKWNTQAATQLQGWLSRLEGLHPEQLLVLIDCDNTAWAGDIADSVFAAAVEGGMISWGNAPHLAGFPFRTLSPEGKRSTPFEYYEHLYEVDPIVAYNYSAQAFSGLTLLEAMKAFGLAKKREDFPKPYAEIKALVEELSKKGVAVGFVSASPLFLIAPMMEESGYTTPLRYLEGIDGYVSDPTETQPPVLLSNLVQSQGLERWSQVLSRFGNYRLSYRVSEIANARRGKAVGGEAIAARYVWHYNGQHPKEPIALSQLRLAGVMGDNWGPFSDLPGSDPNEMGNDQGMARALPFIPQGIVLDIYRAVRSDDTIDLAAKRASYDRFLGLVKQLHVLEPSLVPVVQVVVYKGDPRGFDPTPPPL